MHRVIPRTVWTDLSSESENSSLHELKSEKLLAPAPALCLPWPRRTSLRTRRARDLSAAGNGQAPRVRGSCVKTEGPSRSSPEAARGRRAAGKGARADSPVWVMGCLRVSALADLVDPLIRIGRRLGEPL